MQSPIHTVIFGILPVVVMARAVRLIPNCANANMNTNGNRQILFPSSITVLKPSWQVTPVLRKRVRKSLLITPFVKMIQLLTTPVFSNHQWDHDYEDGIDCGGVTGYSCDYACASGDDLSTDMVTGKPSCISYSSANPAGVCPDGFSRVEGSNDCTFRYDARGYDPEFPSNYPDFTDIPSDTPAPIDNTQESSATTVESETTTNPDGSVTQKTTEKNQGHRCQRDHHRHHQNHGNDHQTRWHQNRTGEDGNQNHHLDRCRWQKPPPKRPPTFMPLTAPCFPRLRIPQQRPAPMPPAPGPPQDQRL